MKPATHIGKFTIWIDDTGQPCCRPGSIEEALPEIKASIGRAEDWIEAVENHQQKSSPEETVRTLKQRLEDKYLSPEHRRVVIALMQYHKRYKGLSKTECIRRWVSAYESNDPKMKTQAEWYRNMACEISDDPPNERGLL